MKRALITLIFFIFLILVWAGLTGELTGLGLNVSLWSPYVLPPPSTVGHYLWDNTVNGKIPLSMLITLRRLLIGYAIGIILGVPLGMLSARFRSVNDTLGMLALGLQALPSVWPASGSGRRKEPCFSWSSWARCGACCFPRRTE